MTTTNEPHDTQTPRDCSTCELNQQLQRAKKAEYQRRWRKAHPERERAAQIRKAANLLRRNGYAITQGAEITKDVDPDTGSGETLKGGEGV